MSAPEPPHGPVRPPRRALRWWLAGGLTLVGLLGAGVAVAAVRGAGDTAMLGLGVTNGGSIRWYTGGSTRR